MKNLELKTLIAAKVNDLDRTITNLINESDSTNVEEIIKKIDLEPIENEVCTTFSYKRNEMWTSSDISFDYHYNYSNIIEQLNANATIAKLKALDELLAIQIIDTKNHWDELSKALRKCFVSSNAEIFTRTLKLHHRIIAFPDTCIEGYKNLLKGTRILLNSRYFADLNRIRVSTVLRLVLGAQKFVVKLLLHANHKTIAEMLSLFVAIIAFKNLTEIIANLDPLAEWFRNFCYGSVVRHALFLNLQGTNLIQTITGSFLNGDEYSAHFLCYYLSYNKDQFEEQHQVLEALVKKHPEKILQVFRTNPALLTTPKILELLLDHPNFEVVSEIVESKHYKILLGTTKKRVKITQKLVNDAAKFINSTTVACIKKLYSCHPIVLHHQANPAKLLSSLHDSYQNADIKLKKHILELYSLLSYAPPDADFFLLQPMKIVPILPHLQHSEALIKNCDKLMKTHLLEPLWYADEHSDPDQALVKLALFLFALKLNYSSAMLFLIESESTIVESDRSFFLSDLVEKTLNNSSNDSFEEYAGLLAMKVMATNADLMLYFLANYQIQEKLEIGEIIDDCSCLKKDILESFQFRGLNSSDVQENELSEFLKDDKGFHNDFGWILHARRAFKNSLLQYNPLILPELLRQIPKTYVYRKKELNWPPPDCVYYQLYPEDVSGISTIISFGTSHGYLDSDSTVTLMLLIKQSRAFLGHQPEEFNNFDWFIGLVYLACKGDYEICKMVIINFTRTPVTSVVWSTFGKEFDAALQDSFHDQLAVLVLDENRCAFQALKLLEISPRMLVQSWLNQCFVKFFPFEEIVNFLLFSVLYPPECLLYYMMAVFKHLSVRICTVTHSPTIENILKVDDLSDFKLNDNIELIEKWGILLSWKMAYLTAYNQNICEIRSHVFRGISKNSLD